MIKFGEIFDDFIAGHIHFLHEAHLLDKNKILYIGPRQRTVDPKSHINRPLNLKKTSKLAKEKIFLSERFDRNLSKRKEKTKKFAADIKNLRKEKKTFQLIIIKDHILSHHAYAQLGSLLSPGGLCFITKGPILPRFIRRIKFGRSDRFLHSWEKQGLFHKALFSFSNEIEPKKRRYRPQQYLLEIVQKKKNKELFIVHNDDLESWEPDLIKSYLDMILINYYDELDHDDLSAGMLCDLKNFKGIPWLETEIRENKIQTDLKKANRYLIGELFKDVKRVNTKDLEEYDFVEEKNTLCVIQDFGSINIISKNTTIPLGKWDIVFLIELNGKLIKRDYLEIYFHSVIGKMYREQCETIEHLRIVPVYLPKITTQNKRIKTGFRVIEKIAELEEVLNDLRAEFANSPSNSEEILKTIQAMIQETRVLTRAEEIQKLINTQMETKITEFKDAYHFNYRVGDKVGMKKIEEKEKMRTLDEINAFLNTDGGQLIFGVQDENNTESGKFEVIGIAKDLKKYKTKDALKTAIINSIRDNFKEVVADYISYDFVSIENKELLVLKLQSYRAKNQDYVYWKDGSKQVKYRSSSSSLDLPISEMNTFRRTGKLKS